MLAATKAAVEEVAVAVEAAARVPAEEVAAEGAAAGANTRQQSRRKWSGGVVCACVSCDVCTLPMDYREFGPCHISRGDAL